MMDGGDEINRNITSVGGKDSFNMKMQKE